MQSLRLSLAIFALLCAGASARAADLGGNCCTDLEERIAELEATTARKGNRKVSLTVSGWVGQQIMFWDDGVETNTYVHDIGSTIASNVKFSGEAAFASGWKAGYVLQIEAPSSDSLTINQPNPRGPTIFTGEPGKPVVRQSYWFVKSDSLGRVSIGEQSQASDNAAILVDGSGSAIPANWVAFDVASFFIRWENNQFRGLGALWLDAGSCHGMGGAWGDCNGIPRNVVRYDTPSFAGFSASASWGEDDMWDVAGRYAGQWGDFKLAATVAYAETTDPGVGAGFASEDWGSNSPGRGRLTYLQAGAYVEHAPTGIFGYGAYGRLEAKPRIIPPTVSIPESETYYAKAGIRRRWSSVGATVMYGEFLRNNDGLLTGINYYSGYYGPLDVINAGSSSLDVWGLGIVQEIDQAAMSVWVKYRHMDADLSVSRQFTGLPLESLSDTATFQYVGAGAIINF